MGKRDVAVDKKRIKFLEIDLKIEIFQTNFSLADFRYEEDKRYLWKSPFKICEDFSFSTSLHLKQIGLGRDFDNFVDKVQKSIVNLDDISKVLGFGLNFKKYAKFKIMTPYMNVWHEKDGRKYDIMKNDRINYNKKNAEFCFDFVIESSLKLQEFDFDINELYI